MAHILTRSSAAHRVSHRVSNSPTTYRAIDVSFARSADVGVHTPNGDGLQTRRPDRQAGDPGHGDCSRDTQQPQARRSLDPRGSTYSVVGSPAGRAGGLLRNSATPRSPPSVEKTAPA